MSWVTYTVVLEIYVQSLFVCINVCWIFDQCFDCCWNTGRQEQADAVLAALEVLPEPHRSMIRTLVDVCAYAGTSQCIPLSYKKFQLMLTRRVKAYSSSCSQIASVYLQPFRCSSLLKCAVQPKIAKKTMKPIIFGVQSLSKSSMSVSYTHLTLPTKRIV